MDGDRDTEGGGERPEAPDDEELMARVRAAPVLGVPLPGFDPDAAPDTPGPLFAAWLARALADGVVEPQVMTLSTVSAGGVPSARVLMLRGIDTARCAYDFASDAGSGKGRDLARVPHAALTWYWPAHGRQIRMTGPVAVLGPEAARRDFLGRSPASRAAGFTGRMSGPLRGREEYERAWHAARETVARHPQRVPPGHTVYRLYATSAEFFQADPGRAHIRLRYDRVGGGPDLDGGTGGDAADGGGPGIAQEWARTLLWP